MAEPIDDYFTSDHVGAERGGPPRRARMRCSTAVPVVGAGPLALFDAQLGSRHLDLAARWLRSQGKGYYTIGSSGHEGNAAVAAALRPTDPALLHYRSGGFFLARAAQLDGSDPLRDVLLGLVAAPRSRSPGGRHKVFGRHDLNIIPQTSTIASHLPRAVGCGVLHRPRASSAWPARGPTTPSPSAASVTRRSNHSTAVGASTPRPRRLPRLPVPLLLVCEDNGIGISVRDPAGWIAANIRRPRWTRYFEADGSDLPATYRGGAAAADWVRTTPEARRSAPAHGAVDGPRGSDVEPRTATLRR